jgi:hypothetical protein
MRKSIALRGITPNALSSVAGGCGNNNDNDNDDGDNGSQLRGLSRAGSGPRISRVTSSSRRTQSRFQGFDLNSFFALFSR